MLRLRCRGDGVPTSRIQIALTVGRVQVDGDERQALQFSAETEPEVRANGLYEALVGHAPARQTFLQHLYSSICEAHEALPAFGPLGDGEQSLLLQFGQRSGKCR